MKTFLATLSPMLTLFICIAVGFVVSKCKILPDNASKVMAKMETWIFCPALAIMTMTRYCTVDKLSMHATNILLAVCVVTISMAIAIFLSRFFAKKGTAERGIYSYALAFANGGYMGDPIVQSLFGDLILSYYKLFYLPLSLMINSWGVREMPLRVQRADRNVIITAADEERPPMGSSPSSTAQSPVLKL